MAPETTQVKTELKLPMLVFGIVEIRRLKRELEALDEYVRQATLRQAGKQPTLPRVSRMLDSLATDNSRNLLQADVRTELAQFLQQVEQTAPTVHVSFASDPSSAFVAKLVTWLRSNIHPSLLLRVGLQPTIAAGCIVRTANKTFDFSLRHRLEEQRALLLESLEDSAVKPPQAQAAPAPISTGVAP